MPACQLCQAPTTVTYHDGERVRVYECDTCARPVVALAGHVDDPSLETEAYALGVARGLFGRWWRSGRRSMGCRWGIGRRTWIPGSHNFIIA